MFHFVSARVVFFVNKLPEKHSNNETRTPTCEGGITHLMHIWLVGCL